MTDEYLRGLTAISENKKRSDANKVITVARSRFDRIEPPSPEKAELAKVIERVGHTNPNTL